MDKSLLWEVIECLPKGRTLFPYFKDRYAMLLLSFFVGGGKKVTELKNGRLKRLLDKPRVKQLLADLGTSVLNSKTFQNCWFEDARHFVLTIGEWEGMQPRWSQTSRKGYNLVLQLNFSNEHDSRYNQLVRPMSDSMLNMYGHPVLRKGDRELFRETLAWARIDLDFDTNEALIEEIQSDWVREADCLLEDARFCLRHEYPEMIWRSVQGRPEDIIEYIEQVLMPYKSIWAEAMLAVTIQFIRNELGIRTVYYHSYETGRRVKHIEYSNPPRSLYTALPRRFCFEKTEQAPDFLYEDKWFRKTYRKIDTPSWYRMDL